MSLECVVDLDQPQSQDMIRRISSARNKRKMTRPKRMLPSSGGAVPSESSHHYCQLGDHGEEELDEEQQSNDGPWNLGDLRGVAAVQLTSSGHQPLDLRSSSCSAESFDATSVVGMDPSYASPADTYNPAEMEGADDPLSTAEAAAVFDLCDAVAMETTAGSSSGHGFGAEEEGETVGGDVVVRVGGKGYKHMSRQRRIEANARERTRVHTISAAFESLRRAVPSYAYNQRLSKLAILRIACSYIVALARLTADIDYDGRATGDDGDDDDGMDFGECVDLCTRTIQAEGRAKRRQ